MRTGKFIKNSYEAQARRIVTELEDVIPALNAEKEIAAIQKKVKCEMAVSLSGKIEMGFCDYDTVGGGGIYISVEDVFIIGNLANKEDCPERRESPGIGDFFINEINTIDILGKLHISSLKRIKPLTFPEKLREYGRKWLL